MNKAFVSLSVSGLFLASPLLAQSNATSELMVYGDTLGNPAQVRIEGMTPNSPVFLLPSFRNTGSNYIVGLTGDPSDVLAVDIDLAGPPLSIFFTGSSDAAGTFTKTLNTPASASLLGKNVYFQGFCKPGGGGNAEFDSFSNIRWYNLNTSNNWQSAGSNLPVQTANVAWTVLERGFQGRATRVLGSGGGPALLTDVTNPYPTTDQTWIYDLNTGQTQSTGTMVTGRAFHPLTTLQDGRVLACGGIAYGGQKANGTYFTNVLKSAEIWDPSTGSWSALPNMNRHRAANTASLLPSGQVLICGGTKGNGNNELADVADLLGTSLNSTEIFDPATNSWSSGPNLAEPKAGHGAIALQNGLILISGGITYTTIFGINFPDFSSQASTFDPATGSFSNAGNIRTKRALFAHALLPNGKVAFFGGVGGDILNFGPIKNADVFNPATNSASGIAPLPADRGFLQALSLDTGQIMVLGGASGDLTDPIPEADVWVWDSVTNSYATASPMTVRRGGNIAEYMEDGTIYVAGGESNSGSAIATAESYSP